MARLITLLIRKTFSIILKFVLKLYSIFIKQNKNQILIYPNIVAYSQPIDVKNYTHECVLVFFNYMLKEKKYNPNINYDYVLSYYQNYQKNIPIQTDSKGQPLYRQIFCPLERKFSFLYLINVFKFYHEYFKSHIIITGDPLSKECLKNLSDRILY